MNFRLYKEDDHAALERWCAERPGKPLPPHPALIPKSSSFVAADEEDWPVALAVFHVCHDAPVASLSWLFAEAETSPRRVHEAVTLVIRGGLYCLDRQGVVLCWSRLTPHGVRRILEREGFRPSPEAEIEMYRIRQV